MQLLERCSGDGYLMLFEYPIIDLQFRPGAHDNFHGLILQSYHSIDQWSSHCDMFPKVLFLT